MNGILVVDKPVGPTSHDIVDAARRLLGQKKVGHTGTLDPMATGVLPLVLGKATKIARYLTGGDKGYHATFRLGITTDTLDGAGEVTDERPVDIDVERVRKALTSLTEIQREALLLAYFGGYTPSQVAALLKLPLGTVKTRMRDGLIGLRHALGVDP